MSPSRVISTLVMVLFTKPFLKPEAHVSQTKNTPSPGFTTRLSGSLATSESVTALPLIALDKVESDYRNLFDDIGRTTSG